MDSVFTIAQIKDAWADYKSKNCWKCMKEGRTTVKFSAPDMAEGYTKVTMTKAREVIDFPTYLEKVHS